MYVTVGNKHAVHHRLSLVSCLSNGALCTLLELQASMSTESFICAVVNLRRDNFLTYCLVSFQK